MRDSKNSHFSGGIPHENPNSLFKFVYVPFRGFLFVGGKISMENKSNGKMHPFVKGLIVGVICMSLVTLVYAIIFILPQIMGH